MGEVVQLPTEKYAFDGRIIKLNKRDYETWKRVYWAVPDLDAELYSMDLYYASEPNPGNWFIRCSTNLGKKHQERVKEKKAEEQMDHEPTKRGPRKFTGVANTMPVKCTPEELQAYNTQYHCQADEVPSWWLSQYRSR